MATESCLDNSLHQSFHCPLAAVPVSAIIVKFGHADKLKGFVETISPSMAEYTVHALIF